MLTLVTGGCRSGKSDFAIGLALEAHGPRAFIATAEAGDAEMEARIRKHRERRGEGWTLIEEPILAAQAVGRALAGAKTAILDCLTLWMSNLVCGGRVRSEEDACREAEELVAAARAADGHLIVVTNEVGWGIVPQNALSRLFRDCAGRANKTVARAADAAWLLVSGIPLPLRAPGSPRRPGGDP
jgi:adenosylcobinamide kinase/adenosylcobinamide-phosphate guanylyltransferase